MSMPLSRRVFNKYDLDHNGTISLDELKVLCAEHCSQLTDREFEWLKTYIDKDGDNVISYDEFAQFWKSKNRFANAKLDDGQMMIIDTIMKIFRAYDKDKSGELDKNEFLQLIDDLLKAGLIQRTQNFEFDEIDRSKNGTINFNELIACLIETNVLNGFGIE
ncbi:unnamed protein product [Didymodactylos carnosus]|uniref:EF-hand domain-containing protein n=1 Tax=Didymodactylos carnosus TaxID=1234261 RepID=A0A815IR05_9BILA|nr:unnamed protein product [Didymodactylos carnosus]CAF1386852.1 unnamed protein product [Didymodactylos carnosus]CAF4194737.1 unnamed protein product [Didymodactylos carnosus]CAF4253869.1 unnamed protein product [Didymodactylos carnosus]